MSKQDRTQSFVNRKSKDQHEKNEHQLSDEEFSTFVLKSRNVVHPSQNNENLIEDDDMTEAEPLLTRAASLPNLSVSLWYFVLIREFWADAQVPSWIFVGKTLCCLPTIALLAVTLQKTD